MPQGGMLEQWHQKLHNNTSPDDVAICEALLAYIDAGLDVAAYWAALQVRSRLRRCSRRLLVCRTCYWAAVCLSSVARVQRA